MRETDPAQISPARYHEQTDEILWKIVATHAKGDEGSHNYKKYRLAFDILQMRSNDRLAKKTWWLVFATWIMAGATIAVAIGTFLLVYFPR